MKKIFDYCKCFLSGTLILFLVLTSSIVSLFKTGVGAVVDTAMLSMCLLTLFHGLTKTNVALSDIFSRAFISGASTISVYLAVLFLNGQSIATSQGMSLVLLVSISASAGILFFSSLSEIFTSKNYAFPQLTSRLEILSAPSNNAKSNITIFGSMALSSLYSFFCKKASIKDLMLPDTSIPLFSNSLLYISTGYFIGFSTWKKMFIGFLYSVVVFAFNPTSTFSSHITNPHIYSVILAFSVVNGLFVIFETLHKWKSSFLSSLQKIIRFIFPLFILSALILFYYLFFQSNKFINPLSISTIFGLTVLTLVSSISTIVGVAETGFWFSSLDDLIPIVAITLVHIRDISQIIFILIGFTSFEMAGIYYIINCRVAQKFEIANKTLTFSSIVSCFFASVITVLFVYLLSQNFSFGESEYPIPNAKVLSFTINSLISAISEFSIPTYFNIVSFLLACVACIVLKHFKISPMTVMSGILLPFGSFITLGIGALIQKYLFNISRHENGVFSGIAIGESLFTTITILFKSL